MNKKEYRSDIDGLRAVAVLLVIFYHIGIDCFSGGFIGVDIFFVISGFLITSILSHEISTCSFSYHDFYKRRIKRLLPAYLIVSLVTTIGAYFLLLPDDLKFYVVSLSSSIVAMSNVFFSMLSGGYFSPRTELFPLLHTWSLSVEEQYYLVWPVLLAVGYKILNKKLLSVVIVLTIFFVVISVYGVTYRASAAYYLIHYRVFELLVGSALAISWCRLPEIPVYAKHVLSITALIVLIGLGLNLTKNSNFPGFNAFYVCVATAVLIYTGIGHAGIANKFLSLRLVVSVGLISYSLYLWHWPIISLLRYRQVEFTPLVSMISMTLIFLLAWTSWYFIEMPVRRSSLSFRALLSRYYVLPVCVVMLFSGVVYFFDGIPQRYEADMQELVSSYSSEVDLTRLCSIRPADVFDLSHEDILTNCSFGEVLNVSPSVLLTGDSHANHFKPFIDVLAKDVGVGAVYHVQGACTAVEGVGFVSDKSVCAARNRMLLSYSDNYDFVVLAGAWKSHKNPAEFKVELSAALEKIISMGARPVVLFDSPSIEEDMSKCPIYTRLGWIDGGCDLKLTDVERLHQGYDDVITKVSEVYPTMVVINPKKILCDKLSCLTEIDDVAIYRDNNHINKKAAQILAEKWLKTYGNPFGDT